MNKDWTSRERVQSVLSHQESDRVPIGLEISHTAYQKLRTYLGFPPLPQTGLCSGGSVRLDADIARLLGIDLAYVCLQPLQAAPPEPDKAYWDEWQVGRRILRNAADTFQMEVVVSPLESAQVEDLADFQWPDPQNPASVRGVEEQAACLFRDTPLALVGRFGGSILQVARDLRGEAQWSRDLVENSEFVCALLNRIASLQIALDEVGLRACGRYLSILEIHEADWNAPGQWIFPPNVWRETIRPVFERRWRAARRAIDRYAPGAKLMLYAPIPRPEVFSDLVEGQIDLFGPLQPDVSGLDLRALKREYSGLLSFWGAVDETLLETGSEAGVREQVKKILEQMSASGGYILAPSQRVQAGARPQNIVAMCETVKVYGRYPATARKI